MMFCGFQHNQVLIMSKSKQVSIMSLRNKFDQHPENGDAIEDQPAAKRTRGSVVDELLCPITLALPLDPVMAEDGRVYERSAILQHFKNNEGNLKSPMTNEPMGIRLVAAYQFKNIIENLVDSGEIGGELAASWKVKRENKQKLYQLDFNARNGDAEAMYNLGRAYIRGLYGVSEDKGKGKQWLKKGSDAGSVKAMASHGYYLALDQQTQSEGIALLTLAAWEGSDCARLQLGKWFAMGKHGLSVNKTQAIRLLEKGLSSNCMYEHGVSQQFRNECKKILEDLYEDN